MPLMCWFWTNNVTTITYYILYCELQQLNWSAMLLKWQHTLITIELNGCYNNEKPME
jgi:hypothetical protein